MVAAINLLREMLKLEGTATKIVNNGIISVLTPILMELEVSPSETDRIDLIRNSSLIFSELTDIPDPVILV